MSAHVARKRFGQNFLVDQQVIAEIIEQLAVQRGETWWSRSARDWPRLTAPLVAAA
jgi:hypothetical protein